MKIPETWLYEWVKPDLPLSDLGHQLTMAGLEIEQIETVAEPFNGVIVASVVSLAPHPNADRLKVCQVDIGEATPVQIVCGAPNVQAGQKVPCALPGARLPGDFAIKRSKIRDVESGGMLCSAQELGMASDVDGLLILPENAPVGVSIRDFLQLDEKLLTLKITPNRGDCLSIRGIAREVSALTKTPLISKMLPTVNVTAAEVQSVLIADDALEACPLYLARVVTDINSKAQTPDWMQQKLIRAGLRSINAVVDVTNYVMLELGQPMHAFDREKLQGAITVRMGKAGEKLALLDQTEANCEGLLVIADNERPVALGGAMGGLDSGVTLETNQIVLEAAYFSPATVAKTARTAGIQSDSAYRFERGVDFSQTAHAMERATELILAICGGKAGKLVQVEKKLPQKQPVQLCLKRVSKVLGMDFSAQTVAELFDRLGFSYTLRDDVFSVSVPIYRFDISIDVDLIEEIARVYGYNNIVAPSPVGEVRMLGQKETTRSIDDIKNMMVSMGYFEAINFSFIDASIEKELLENNDPVTIINPIASHLTVMRSSLIGSLVLALSNNLARKQNRVRLFEIGRCFSKDQGSHTEVSGYRQPVHLAAIAYGSCYSEQWGVADKPADFFDVKGDLEKLLSDARFSFQSARHPALHPGRCAAVYDGDKQIGIVGELHPKWQQHYRFPFAPVLFEIEYAVIDEKPIPAFKALSKFQPVIRDLAFIVEDNISAGHLLACLNSALLDMDAQFILFDHYRGAGVSEGYKSLAYRIVFQKEQNLTEEEIEHAISQLIQAAKVQCNAQLRS